MQELKGLYTLLDTEQPELVYRMSFVHAVTVMEAYLMYCAGLCWKRTCRLHGSGMSFI